MGHSRFWPPGFSPNVRIISRWRRYGDGLRSSYNSTDYGNTSQVITSAENKRQTEGIKILLVPNEILDKARGQEKSVDPT